MRRRRMRRRVRSFYRSARRMKRLNRVSRGGFRL